MVTTDVPPKARQGSSPHAAERTHAGARRSFAECNASRRFGIYCSTCGLDEVIGVRRSSAHAKSMQARLVDNAQTLRDSLKSFSRAYGKFKW